MMSEAHTQDRTAAERVYHGSRQREWERLALDTLSRLTTEFAVNQNTYRLVDLALLCITGQLRATGACAVFDSSLARGRMLSFRGTGLVHDQRSLQGVLDVPEYRTFLVVRNRPVRTGDLPTEQTVPAGLYEFLRENRVAAITPVAIGSTLLGILGVARRVDGAEFDDGAMQLLKIMSNTIAPLLSNSLLYARLDSLYKWHSDVVDSVGQGVIVFRQDFHVAHANKAARAMLASLSVHAPWEEPALRASDIFSESRFAGWLDFLSLSAEREFREPETLVARAGGVDRVFRAYVARTSGGATKVHDIVLTLDEITEQRETDERMFELEKFAEQGVMAASIAHELNNYLALILGGVELAQMNLESGDEASATVLLDKLKNHAVAMSRFTAGLTDTARFASGRSSTDLNGVVRDVVAFARLQKRYSGLSISTNLAGDMPEAKLDADQIAQLLMNLLNNAADAIRDQGRDNGAIDVSTTWCDSTVSLEISDDGVGMPPELQKKLFKTGFTTKKGGHGFGMVTCGRILEQHNAKYDVSSRPGEGTTIRISFPR